MNPLNDPVITYLRVVLAVRIDRLRSDEERSRGASAIEWAIITGVLVIIALGVYTVVRDRVNTAKSQINTQNP